MKKNPWHTRRKNQKYKEILAKVAEETLTTKFKLEHSIKEFLQLKMKNEEIIKKSTEVLGKQLSPSILEQLPIESLKDLYEIETDGKTSKPKFSDLLKAEESLKEVKKSQDKIVDLASNIQVAKIENIQAQIDAIIKIIDGDK